VNACGYEWIKLLCAEKITFEVQVCNGCAVPCISPTHFFPHNTPMQGIFISFEGIDGAGKSSHIQALAQAFQGGLTAGRQVILTREPGGTGLSERLRELILHEPMDALTEALLVFAARREHIVQVIAPALARGDVVLCDRFTDASFAYQGAGRGFDLQVLSKLEHSAQDLSGLEADLASKIRLQDGLLQPDLTLLFEVPPQVAAQRLALARQPDKFESQNLQFFERVAAGYAARVAAHPQRFARIDGHQSLQEVRAKVMQAVRERGFLPQDVLQSLQHGLPAGAAA
jgi:dTMP kinase